MFLSIWLAKWVDGHYYCSDCVCINQSVGLIKADYQFDLRLLSYVNPRGLTDDGQCCEPLLEVSVWKGKLVTLVSQCSCGIYTKELGGNMVVGTFENNNSITFPTCGSLTSDIDNPLLITFLVKSSRKSSLESNNNSALFIKHLSSVILTQLKSRSSI